MAVKKPVKAALVKKTPVKVKSVKKATKKVPVAAEPAGYTGDVTVTDVVRLTFKDGRLTDVVAAQHEVPTPEPVINVPEATNPEPVPTEAAPPADEQGV